jgi:hypothetical protein
MTNDTHWYDTVRHWWDSIKPTLDWAAIGTIFTAFFELIPDVSAFFGLVWILIRIYETDTVQRLIGKKKD